MATTSTTSNIFERLKVVDLASFIAGPGRGPQEVIDDPQLRVNDIVVPPEGAGAG
jgi:hypothetical protein